MERKYSPEINPDSHERSLTHDDSLKDNPKNHPWELVDEYIAGELDPDLLRQVASFLNTVPGAEESLCNGRIHVDETASKGSSEQAWARLSVRVHANATSSSFVASSVPDNPVIRRYTYLYRSAIALLLVISATLGIKQFRILPDNNDRFEYSASRASQGNITLPDGTEILLNPQSSISVETGYLNTSRTVHLQGSAKFIVKQKGARPFTVVTDNAEVRVLGTVFSVSSSLYDEKSTIVRVVEGRVAVGDIVAGKGQTIATSGSNRTSADTRLLTGRQGIDYEDGLLLATDVKIADLIPYLNEWYNMDIVVDDRNILETLVTAQFKLGTVTDLTDMMKNIFGVKVVHKDQRLIFTIR